MRKAAFRTVKDDDTPYISRSIKKAAFRTIKGDDFGRRKN